MRYESPIMEKIIFDGEGIIITSNLGNGTWDTTEKKNENIDGDGF